MGKPNVKHETVTLVFFDTWEATCIVRDYRLTKDCKGILDVAKKLNDHKEGRYIVISIEVGYEENRWMNRITQHQYGELIWGDAMMMDAFNLQELPRAEG